MQRAVLLTPQSNHPGIFAASVGLLYSPSRRQPASPPARQPALFVNGPVQDYVGGCWQYNIVSWSHASSAICRVPHDNAYWYFCGRLLAAEKKALSLRSHVLLVCQEVKHYRQQPPAESDQARLQPYFGIRASVARDSLLLSYRISCPNHYVSEQSQA